jgi:sugar phosphate isomerase/epimerase
MFSRRELGKLTLGALSMSAIAAKKIDSVVHGIQFGLQSYIFTRIGLPQEGLVETVIASMVECGLGECDFYAPLVEGAASLDSFRTVRKKFDDAGIAIYGLSGFPWATDQDLGRTFEIAEVLGARLITLTVTLPAAKRIVPLVEKSRFLVGIQGNPNMNPTNPDAISRPENYDEAVSLSKSYGISFDIGDATGGGYDALKFVETHHDRISLIYLKDRRKDRLSVPWGEGDTPVAEILRLIRDGKYPIRCYLDCDYKTTNRPADVKRSFEYAKKALDQ